MVVNYFSHDQHYATPWTVAHQATLSHDIIQARILEGVAMLSSRGPQHKKRKEGREEGRKSTSPLENTPSQ